MASAKSDVKALQPPHFSIKLYGEKVVEVTHGGSVFISTYKIRPDGRYDVKHIDEEHGGMRDHVVDEEHLPSYIRERFEGKFGEDDTITQRQKNN
jgi:hypothetical protein